MCSFVDAIFENAKLTLSHIQITFVVNKSRSHREVTSCTPSPVDLFWCLLVHGSCLLSGQWAVFSVPTGRTNTVPDVGKQEALWKHRWPWFWKSLCEWNVIVIIQDSECMYKYLWLHSFNSLFFFFWIIHVLCCCVALFFFVESLKGFGRKRIIQPLSIGDRPFHRGLLTECCDFSADGTQQCPPGKWPSCPHLPVAEEGGRLPATLWGGLQGPASWTESRTVLSPPWCGSVTLKKHFFHSHNLVL